MSLPLLTAAQMQALDRIAIEAVGIPSLVLMEVAGRGVLDAAVEAWADAPPGAYVVVLAGTGNNGADAIVVARHLTERNIDCVVFVLGERERASPEMKTQLDIAATLGVAARFVTGPDGVEAVRSSFDGAHVVIDGIFGTGLARPVEGWRAEIVAAVGGCEGTVIAVDIPSGISADTGAVLGVAVEADVTVTFQCAKLGHVLHPGRAHTQRLHVVDIGIPESRLPEVGPFATLVDDDMIAEALPPRAPNSHKGTYGHVLVVAGHPDRPGAALLAARAAQRIGAGLVTLGSDAETIRRLAPAFGSLMGLTVGAERPEADKVQEALRTRTALVIGPSLEPDAETRDLLKAVLTTSAVPVVLDAGALSALGPDQAWIASRPGPTVLTPHPGEMGRLLGTDARAVQLDRVAAARRAAAQSGAVVVLKGASTVIASPEGVVAVVLEGNPGLATGGTGDVLAGMIGGLLGQGVEPALAAAAAAALHGRAGDAAAEAVTQAALTAEDLLHALPRVLPEAEDAA